MTNPFVFEENDSSNPWGKSSKEPPKEAAEPTNAWGKEEPRHGAMKESQYPWEQEEEEEEKQQNRLPWEKAESSSKKAESSSKRVKEPDMAVTRNTSTPQPLLPPRTTTPNNLSSATNLNSDKVAPNWPKCKPMIYHDIDKEIPSNCQSFVRTGYVQFWVTCVTFFSNFISACALVAIDGSSYGISGLLLAILYFIIEPPLFFYFCYYSLYKAARNDSSFSYIVFFVNFGIHVALCIFFMIGIFSTGGAGIIPMIDGFKKNLVGGIFCAITTGLFCYQIIGGIILLRLVGRHYRGQGHSLESAGNEAGRNAANNPAVQRAALQAAKDPTVQRAAINAAMK